MSVRTDPARELSDLIRTFSFPSNGTFDNFLAAQFEVDVWSSEFYDLIFIMSSRIDHLISIVDTLELDDDQKEEVKENLRVIQRGFGPEGLRNAPEYVRNSFLGTTQLAPLSTLSGLVRSKYTYPKLSEDECNELFDMTEQLIGWLEEHQLSEQDFIRQALLEGLVGLRFRLKRTRWLGRGYTVEGLREVILAYFALERGFPRDGSNPPVEALLKRVGEFTRNFVTKAGMVRDFAETGDFMLRAYGAIHLAISGPPVIAGFLSYTG